MYPVIKRAIDVLVSLLLLVLVSPLLALAALAIVAETPGSPVFVQERVGLGGRTFPLLKLRSMVRDAPARGSFRTGPEDSRVTRVGAWLRRSSVDELPQLCNVLRGEMSLVGPRPDVPAQRADYPPAAWTERHRVRPGLTGLAQATLRSSATPAQRLAMDLEYVRSASFLLDLRIAGLTVRQVFGQGSH